MKSPHIERHLRALNTAKECAYLGARLRTIRYVTGLPHNELCALFFAERDSIPRGRPPDTQEWYHTTNLFNRVEASIAASLYRRLRDLDFGPAESLIASYKHYRSVHRLSQISFDRAFDLAAHLDGIWLMQNRTFSLACCPRCACQYLTSLSLQPHSNHECPFCKLLRRLQCDPRVRQSFPAHHIPVHTIPDLDRFVRGERRPVAECQVR